MPKKVIVYLPKFGLGNMLLVWAKGLVFAKQNNLPFYCFGWNKIHWGAIIRGENHKRFYAGYFKTYGLFRKLHVTISTSLERKILNPDRTHSFQNGAANFIFDELKTNNEMFKILRPHQSFIKQSLVDMLRPALRDRFDSLEEIEIAVHIRRGDFRLSHLATPLEYFIKVIETIRLTNGSNVAVKVFTDGKLGEMESIMQLENIEIVSTGFDILDILWMSKSKVLVLSPSSSFSYWSAFLSEAKVIIKEDDWQWRIKEDNEPYLEIRWPEEEDKMDPSILRSLNVYQGNFKSTKD